MPTLNKNNGQTGTQVNKEDNKIDLDRFKRAINIVENSGDMDYSKLNESGSNAIGPYQIIYGDVHKKNLKDMYGVESKDEFINSPDIQESYMDWLSTKSYPRMLKSLKKQYGPGGDNLTNNAVADFSESGILGDFSDYDLMAMEHFLGHEDTRKYFASIREGREDQFKVPGKNMGVREYLDKFQGFFNKDSKDSEDEESDDEDSDKKLPSIPITDDSEKEERPAGPKVIPGWDDVERPMRFIDNEDNPMDDLGKTGKK